MKRMILLATAMVVMAVQAETIKAQSLGDDGAVGRTRHALVYDRPAADSQDGWERESLPIGCGWFGASVFGGTSSERIELTDNTLLVGGNLSGLGVPSTGDSIGLTSAGRLRIDFPHSDVAEYRRTLGLDNALATVSYLAGGVHYTREYFASYPARVLAGRLAASRKGALEFALRFEPYAFDRTAEVRSEGRTVDVDQRFGKFDIRHALRILVDTDGETSAEGGGLKVRNATWANIYLAEKSNYRLEPRVFLEPDPLKKLSGNPDPRPDVVGLASSAAEKGYFALRDEHVRDHAALYGRVSLDLGGTEVDRGRTTDSLKADYAKGVGSAYLEELLFQYGRYLLIASSRPDTMPANLQGTWTCGERSPWGAGYWHNINVQMNYWPAFSCNLAECFKAYAAFNEAFRPAAREIAVNFLKKYVPENVPAADEAPDMWVTGCTVYPYRLQGMPGASSGPGMGGLTGKLFADWWDYTHDEDALQRYIRPVLNGLADFYMRATRDYDGKRLSVFSASPEMMINVERNVAPGGVYYNTVGCAFDQQMIAESVLDANRIGGFRLQSNPYFDPVQIGWSGQIKEYREENYYGEIGMYRHRHISQLVGLMPGSIMNHGTPAWIDAALRTLNERGDWATGWALAHRLCLRARAGDGDGAYRLYSTLLSVKTYPNLWDSHPPFQIDGNFGATAGVAEMLLQSGNGEIELLPALPAAWAKKGSFRGLCARGGHEVDCEWEGGKVVNFAVRGGTSTPKVAKPGPRPQSPGPSNLRIDRSTMTLSWTPSATARRSYTVLRNRRSSPDYETLASGFAGCEFRDATASFRDEDYITYKVVSEDGASVLKTFSRATELEKQRYLNIIRSKGSVEKGAPWIPTTRAPEKSIEDLE